MNKKRSRRVIVDLLSGLNIGWVTWGVDQKTYRGCLTVGLVRGEHTWSQLRQQISDDKMRRWAREVYQVAIDYGEGALISLETQGLRGAGFAPAVKDDPEEDWCFSFFVARPPDGRSQAWRPPHRLVLKTRIGDILSFCANGADDNVNIKAA